MTGYHWGVLTISVLSLTLLLGGCCSAPIVPPPSGVCPQLSVVAQNTRDKLSNELKPLSGDSAIVWSITDWIKLRAQVRACLDNVK